MARLEGPVVASVNAVFLSDWYSETDEILTDEIDLFDVKSGRAIWTARSSRPDRGSSSRPCGCSSG